MATTQVTTTPLMLDTNVYRSLLITLPSIKQFCNTQRFARPTRTLVLYRCNDWERRQDKGGENITEVAQTKGVISRTIFCLFRLSRFLLCPSPLGRACMPPVNGRVTADQSRLGVPELLVLSQNHKDISRM